MKPQNLYEEELDKLQAYLEEVADELEEILEPIRQEA